MIRQDSVEDWRSLSRVVVRLLEAFDALTRHRGREHTLLGTALAEPLSRPRAEQAQGGQGRQAWGASFLRQLGSANSHGKES